MIVTLSAFESWMAVPVTVSRPSVALLMTTSVPDVPKVEIALWRADAVVLFAWLMTVDLDAVPISHPAEKQALADLLARLELETDVPGVTQEEVDAARADVARDMGW